MRYNVGQHPNYKCKLLKEYLSRHDAMLPASGHLALDVDVAVLAHSSSNLSWNISFTLKFICI